MASPGSECWMEERKARRANSATRTRPSPVPGRARGRGRGARGNAPPYEQPRGRRKQRGAADRDRHRDRRSRRAAAAAALGGRAPLEGAVYEREGARDARRGAGGAAVALVQVEVLERELCSQRRLAAVGGGWRQLAAVGGVRRGRWAGWRGRSWAKAGWQHSDVFSPAGLLLRASQRRRCRREHVV
jgi:hypothetical protein